MPDAAPAPAAGGAAAPPPPTAAVLMSIAKHVAVRCSAVNRAYAACKDADADPSKCLAAGEASTDCVVGLLKEMHAAAPAELSAYCACMDYYSNRFPKCRAEQKALEEAFPVSK
jgi:NADH dehydrogenase (ubiquinone) 1 alpha subcomplex subunit 8